MWGRKDKKEKRGEKRKGSGPSKGSAGLPFMGLGVPPGVDESDEALEAELLALQGKSPRKEKKESSKVMSMKDIDSMVAGLEEVGEDESEEEEGSEGEDDNALLEELKEIADQENEEATPTATPTRQPDATPSKPPSAQMAAVVERLAMYERALLEAKRKNEGTKVRRYTRAVESIKSLQKKAQSGKPVDIDNLPPPVAPSAGGGEGPQTPVASSGGGGGGITQSTMVTQKDIKDDELMAWASDLSPQQLPLRPQPPPSVPPKPKPRPSTPPTTSDGRIDLDAPEFDEFNLSEEDMAMLAAQMDTQKKPASQPSPPQPKPRPQAMPPQPKPRPSAPPTTRDGRINLDAPEFDEFNLSEEDMTMLAAQMDTQKKPASQPSPPQPKPRPQAMPPQPKPRPSAPPTTRDGRINLDAPEFNLSVEDMTMLAAQMDTQKRQKLNAGSTSAHQPLPVQSLPATLPPGGPPSKGDVRAVLGERKDQYTAAMKQAKAQGSTTKAQEFGKMAARFNKVLKALDQGQNVDLSLVPLPPPGFTSKLNFDLSKYKAPTVQPSPQPSAVVMETPQGSITSSSQTSEPAATTDSSIPVPRTVMEALEQRLAKYEATQAAAQEKGESSRARRMARIIKQYQEAMKMTKLGKPFDYSDLPDPPGYPPIPVRQPPTLPKPTQSLPPQRTAVGSKFMPNPTVSQDQMDLLTQRQKELLAAVKEAKVKGDREKALHYLRQYKGMEKMIVAASNGLPVDLSQVPPSPFADLSKTKPATAVLSHLKPASEGDDMTFDRIKRQLQAQIDLCNLNAKTYEDIKNVGTATQYQNMCRELQQELLAIEGIQSHGLCPPKFTMETRKFAIVHTNMDISAGQCEVEVVKATAIPQPDGYEEKDLNVYVEIEFPWPSDASPKICTDSIRGIANPEFNHKERFEIERKLVRSIVRVLKRNPLKCTIWQKRTLRKHIFIGQAVLQLDKLETRCKVKATVDLLDEKARKPVGGKMELVARLREPFSGRDTEEKEEQWLMFQESIAVTSSVQMPRPSPSGPTPSQNLALLSPIKIENTTSAEALKVELSLVQSALKAGHKDAATVHKGRQIQARLQVTRQRLQTDPQFRAVYQRQVTKEMQLEQTLETRLLQAGKTREVKILQLRRQAMQQEIKSMSGRK